MSFGAIATDYDRLRPSPPAGRDPTGCCRPLRRRRRPRGGHRPAHPRDRARGAATSSRSSLTPGWRRCCAPAPPACTWSPAAARRFRLRRGAADALLISSAWHWMDPATAVPEIARVLRDGGRFGVIWTSRDRSVDWVAELDRLRQPLATSEYRRRGREVKAPRRSACSSNVQDSIVHVHQDDVGRGLRGHDRHLQRADHGESGRARRRARAGQGRARREVPGTRPRSRCRCGRCAGAPIARALAPARSGPSRQRGEVIGDAGVEQASGWSMLHVWPASRITTSSAPGPWRSRSRPRRGTAVSSAPTTHEHRNVDRCGSDVDHPSRPAG